MEFFLYIHSNIISKLCVEKRGRVEECSVAPLCDKKGENLVWLSILKSKNQFSIIIKKN
jgi:hypothetical protein